MSSNYFIANINAQLAWNLFVESPKEGGVTTIYNKPWNVKVKKEEEPTEAPLELKEEAKNTTEENK